VPVPDVSVAFGQAFTGAAPQSFLKQIGQFATQLPAEHVISPVFGTKLASQSYVRVLPSVMPVPDVSVAFVQAFAGATPQPIITQFGQLSTQRPAEHVISPVFGTNPLSQSYIRILPSVIPVPDVSVAFVQAFAGAAPQVILIQFGQESTQEPDDKQV